MDNLSEIEHGAEVIGADGVHVGTVDHVQEGRIKLSRRDSVDDRHHYVSAGLIAGIENGKVRLSANADVAITLEDESDAARGL
ncbi:MAG: hypothetical protein JWM33_1641 [Caulobacteraceae bacterium]|nr:hypothetical protein [Caulobacteraceae bacterium]